MSTSHFVSVDIAIHTDYGLIECDTVQFGRYVTPFVKDLSTTCYTLRTVLI